MALTGQLSDMSLAELIEFFCNQRKTGRLKVDYHRGHGVFFIKDGELVDAKVGSLSGAEAVYFALTLPNAAFDFSPEFQPSRRTIMDKWTQVVLEGLRRLDENSSPTETDAFGGWTPSDADLTMFMDHVDRLGENAARDKSKPSRDGEVLTNESPVSASESGGKKKWMAAAAAACLVLVIAVVAIPLSGRSSNSKPPAPAASSAPSSAASTNPSTGDPAAVNASDTSPSEAAPAAENVTPDDGALAAQRAREQRQREQREREKRQEELARKNDLAGQNATPAATPAPAAAPPAGPKSVRVSITYDEAGRVTAASVAGSSPGAEAYAGTAVRVARGKRFPAGKAGSTVVTITVN